MLIITPSRDEFTKGLRRARKVGRRRVPFNADGASGFLHVLLIGLIGASAFAIFSCEMFGSKWFTPKVMGDRAPKFSMEVLRCVPFSQILFVSRSIEVAAVGDNDNFVPRGEPRA